MSVVYEQTYAPRELAKLFHGVKNENEIRAMTRREVNPLPHMVSGTKRPTIKIRPSVFDVYLLYEQRLVKYDAVVEAAKRGLAEVR